MYSINQLKNIYNWLNNNYKYTKEHGKIHLNVNELAGMTRSVFTQHTIQMSFGQYIKRLIHLC